MSKKPALFYAEAIAVCCPYCEATQANPNDGSEMWLPEQIKALYAKGQLKCSSCDEVMRIASPSKATIQ